MTHVKLLKVKIMYWNLSLQMRMNESGETSLGSTMA